MAEQLALAEQVQHAAVVHELDRAAADHVHLVLRALALLEDRGPGGEELHLRVRGEAVQLGTVELAERVVLLQELGDVSHPALTLS